MSGHIEIEKQLADDPVIAEIGARYGRPAVLGTLALLWIYADTHLRSNGRLPMSIGALASTLGVNQHLLKRLQPRWLQIGPDGNVILPGYAEKIVARAKKRAGTRQRVQACRQRKKKTLKNPGDTTTVVRQSTEDCKNEWT